jgi:hypothetical protein
MIFSLNYDVYNFLIDNEIKKYFKYLNFVIRYDFELKRFMTLPYAFNDLINKINRMIIPMETTFFIFITLYRYLILNPKSGILKVDEIKDIAVIYEISLIDFLDSFRLTAENIKEV